MVEFFREEFSVPLPEPVEMNETLMFSLRDTELFTLKPGSPVPKLREQVEEVVGSAVPRYICLCCSQRYGVLADLRYRCCCNPG